MIPLTRRTLLLPCLAIGLLVTVRTASAAVREPPLLAKAPAAPDTAHFLPRWLHSNGSAGYGWIQGPALIRQRYEAGQDFELGLEARPRPRLRVRLSGEYQILPAVANATYAFVSSSQAKGTPVIDTLSFEWRQRGWLGAARGEFLWRALPHTWLVAGAGRGYLGAGVRAFHFSNRFETLDVPFPGSSGWGWIASAGARYDFDLFGPMLGAELRWSAFDRPQDRLHMWSLRIGWQGK
ncbi:MAG TPA: hypothetical protein VI504_13470 [Candidatus Eisenbacteria bacterium]|jgi:hypothetical protein